MGVSLFGSLRAGVALYACVILSSVIVGVTLRPFHKSEPCENRSTASAMQVCSVSCRSVGTLFTTAIRESALSMLTVSATVVFFSSLVGCIGASLSALGAPDAVIAVDALAAREADRLARTIQISDTGITPGSGVGNMRSSLNEKTVGVPVIAIGVPTVVDTATLLRDALEGFSPNEEIISSLAGLFVAPKEIDAIAENMGKVIGYAINRTLHGNFPYEEMAMMV